MALRLDDIVVRLRMQAGQYFATVKSVEARALAMERKVSAIGTRMSLAITAPLTIIGGLAAREFSKFDDAMTKSTAIMDGVTGDVRKNMEDIARSIGRESITAPRELAESYFFLASAGLNAEQSMAALASVEKFAVAGAFDMAKATDLLTDAQSALGLTTKDAAQNLTNMERVSDTLLKANTLANATAEQFSTSIVTKSGAAAKQYKKSVEELTAVLAAFADQGVKGQLAGERTAILWRELQLRSIKNADAFKKMNIRVFDMNGEMRNTADILQDMEHAFDGLSSKQKRQNLLMLGFSARSVDAVQQLVGVSDKVREYERQLNVAGGTTEQVAERQLKSFASQMKILLNNVRDVGIDIGRILAPGLLWLNEQLQAGIRWWRSLSSGMQSFLVLTTVIVAAVGPLLVLIAALAAGIVAVATAVATLSPSFLVFAGLTAIIAPLIPLVILFRDQIWNMMKATGTAVMMMIGFFQNFSHNIQVLMDWLPRNWDKVMLDMIQAVLLFVKNMAINFMIGLETVMRLWIAFQGWWKSIAQSMGVQFGMALVRAMREATSRIVPFFMNLQKLWKDVWKGSFDPKEALRLFNQALSDFEEGGKEVNFFKTAGRILSEQRNKLKSPLDGFKSFIDEVPDLKFGMEEELDKPVEQLKAIGDVAAETHEQFDKPFTARFVTEGLDAVEAGTAKAFSMLMKTRALTASSIPLPKIPTEEASTARLSRRALTLKEIRERDLPVPPPVPSIMPRLDTVSPQSKDMPKIEIEGMQPLTEAMIQLADTLDDSQDMKTPDDYLEVSDL